MIRKDRGTPQEDAIHVAKFAPFVLFLGLAFLHIVGLIPSTRDQHDATTQGQSSGR